MSDDPSRPGHRLPRRLHFVAHFAVFAITASIILAAEAASGSDWPLFWPVGLWAAALVIHYFVASSYDLDRDWIDERTAEIRGRSYDFDHIENIEQRIRKHDPSVTPRAGRDRESQRG